MEIKFNEINTIENITTVNVADDAFVKNAPVDKDTLEKVYKYENQFTEKLAEKSVDTALEHFKNGEVNRVEVTSPFRVDDELNINIYKDYESDNKTSPRIIIAENDDVSSLTKNLKELEVKMQDELTSVTV